MSLPVLLAVLFSGSFAVAAPPSETAERNHSFRPVVVLIVSRKDAKTAESMIEIVSGQLASLPVRFKAVFVDDLGSTLPVQAGRASRIAAHSHAMAVFWADISLGRQIFVYLSQRAGGRILVRTVSAGHRALADRILALAIVVETSVRALLRGARIALAPPAAKALVVAPSRTWLDVTASYGFFPVARGALAVHGARLSLGLRATSHLTVFAAYRLLVAASVTNEDVHLTLRSHPIELGLRAGWFLSRFGFAGGASVWVDPLTWTAIPVRSGVWVVPPSSRWNVGATIFGRVEWIPVRQAALVLDIGLDAPFLEKRYVSRILGESHSVVNPWKVRPWIALGLRLTPF
ncbi:MAG: hypothetical protein J7M25_03720 [Deltaproteobacteria bacterium]|nr:hypothetical protein [Deltaproteobacteria bacterium]